MCSLKYCKSINFDQDWFWKVDVSVHNSRQAHITKPNLYCSTRSGTRPVNCNSFHLMKVKQCHLEKELALNNQPEQAQHSSPGLVCDGAAYKTVPCNTQPALCTR